MAFELSEEERRLNVTSRLLAVVSSFGGQYIVASPQMNDMVEQLADAAQELARRGLLPVGDDPDITVAPPTLDADVRADNVRLSNRAAALEWWIIGKGYDIAEVNDEIEP